VTDATPPPAGGWRRYYTRTRALVAAASAALLGTVAVLNATLDVVDRIRGDDTCADVHSIVLAPPDVSPSVTRGQSLELDGASKSGLTRERLLQPGRRVAVDVTAKGYKAEQLDIEAWMLTEGGAPVPGAELSHQLVETWTPSGCEDSKQATVWAPAPATPGRYQIQIQIRDKAAGNRLKSAKTEAFAVEAPPA
jgi:hypothetical protein